MSEPDWARFGLATPTCASAPNSGPETAGTESTGGTDASTSSEATEATRLRNPEVDEALYGGREEELFSEERELEARKRCTAFNVHQADHKPWWLARQFFVRERLLFGRWDGVFTSCLVNLLGVIVFLRAGWIVAQAGVAMASLIVLMSVLVVLTSVLSAVGICERSLDTRGEEEAASGGVYFLIGHVLGGRIGAAVGLVYCFGQTASITLCVAGFGESIAELLEVSEESSLWVQRGVSASALLLLALINMAGVKWVVKVQFVLLFLIMLAVLDFLVGSFLPAKEEDGVLGWSLATFRSNSAPAFTAGESSFTVAGVFFPSVTGIMAGINMSGDLRSPSSDIPAGTLSALGFSSGVYLLVMYVLAATVDRPALLSDYMITEKVSAVGVLLLVGLYTSSLSSSVASLYGTPRVLQSIAAENVIPFMKGLAKGRGPNQVPVNGVLLVVGAAGACLLIGNINALAPIVSTPFLLTYATVDYAYFTLAVTADMRAAKHHRSRLTSGDGNTSAFGWGAAAEGMLDRLFPERVTHHKKIITSVASSDSSSLATTPDDATSLPRQQSADGDQEDPYEPGIAAKTEHWYSCLCNRWVALAGAFVKLTLMLTIDWLYGLLTLVAAAVVYFYVGHAAPGLPPGIAGHFSFVRWVQLKCLICLGRAPSEAGVLIVAPAHPGVEVESSQLTEHNSDFAARSRYHASEGGTAGAALP